MKQIICASFAVLIVVASCSFTPKDKQEAAGKPPLDKGFAVVELFTSEGCSSCPPADNVMAALAKKYADRPVLFVGMHVDYWNHLGWKDEFSQHVFTERQNEYGHYLHNEQSYTPQAIVNGRMQMIGSGRIGLIAAIDETLNTPGGSNVYLQAKPSGKDISVQYKAPAMAARERVVLLLVQKKATTVVKRGENSGRTLEHINVVRGIQYMSEKEGSTLFALPKVGSHNSLFVAALLQSTVDGRITAFAQYDL